MPRILVVAAVLLASTGLAACNDNVFCVFSTGCSGGGTISDNEAFLPVDGEWIQDGPPAVDGFFPEGTENAGTTPVVLVFSESMQEESLQGAIEIVPLAGGFGDVPLPGVQQALVCEGRVLVLFPPAALPLDPDDYLVRLADDAVPLDLTGQVLDVEPGETIGNFSVTDPDPDEPALVMSFPGDGDVDQGETTQILVVFDRPVEVASVNALSFDVRVAGVPPASDPAATPVAAPAPDARAFVYRSADAAGRPVPLGTDVEVEVRLSPAAAPITEDDDDELAPVTLTFQTLAFEPPLAASLLSDPSDAIGLANLTDGNTEELAVEVELDAAQANDNLDLFLFGEQKSDDDDPPLIALQPRTLRLSGSAPITSAIFTREEVALQISDSPSDVRFEDGPVTFAFRLRRGAITTPLRVLDLDPDPDTIQDPVLDTVVPVIEALLNSDGTDVFRADLRDLSLAGTTGEGERLRSVEVTTPLGNNGALPPAIAAGAGAGDAFLAAPVPLGVLASGGTTYSFTARDAAQNSAAALSGAFTQLGVLRGGALVPDGPLVVEVFDARSLEPIAGARLITHADLGDGVNYPFIETGLTLADGTLQLTAPPATVAATILTVAHPGYDLFTLHGVPSARVSVPLFESNVNRARADGLVRTSDAGAAAFLGAFDRRYDDSRRRFELPRGFVGQACGSTAGVFQCAYGPESIGEERLGARSFFAGDFLQETSFSASQLLRAFALSVPLAPATRGSAQTGVLEVESLLDDPGLAPEDATQEVRAFNFRLDAASGVDLLDLADDPATTGALFADVEVLIPGLKGALAVSQALSYGPSGGPWSVRAALPGAITAAGSLGADEIVDPDPFVRVEIVDDAGNAAGARPRLSTILALPPSPPDPEFRALSVPTPLAPLQGANSGGQAFDLRLTHVIGDERAENQKGLYRVELEDLAGRVWTVWRFDPSGAADVRLRVVDPADGAGTGLADGTLLLRASAYAWSGLDPLNFLWSDLEREFELFARAEEISFLKP